MSVGGHGSTGPVPPPDEARGSADGAGGFGRRTLSVVLAVLVLFVLAEAFVEHHGHFDFEELFALHALIGFGGVAAAAVLATVLDAVLGREEGYYDG